ncbi:hypothetical protein JW998_08465 [candidate division KSB1 bacterium]|nr:hypothetical protein [candidate division KSB1 bacterium]
MLISRRRFLHKMGLAATLAAPTIIPSSAFGRSMTAPSDRICLGHIGVGGRGSDLLRSLLQVDGQHSVAVCDLFSDRRVERALKVDQFYGDKFNMAYRSCAQ